MHPVPNAIRPLGTSLHFISFTLPSHHHITSVTRHKAVSKMEMQWTACLMSNDQKLKQTQDWSQLNKYNNYLFRLYYNTMLLGVILGFRRGWTEFVGLLGYHAAYGGMKPTFRATYRSHLQGISFLKSVTEQPLLQTACIYVAINVDIFRRK